MEENQQQLDVEVIVDVVPFQDGCVVEAGKLTNHAIRIDIDGSQFITIPATTTIGQHSF